MPPWLPNLTPDLVAAGWSRLDRDCGLTRASYGTTRMLSRNPEGTRSVVKSLDARSHYNAKHDSIQIEVLSQAITRQWSSADFRFFGAQEIQGDGVTDRVEVAIELLDGVPTLLGTVRSLIRSLHVLDTSDDQVDVSFSEPDMPFSVFVSVPGPDAHDGTFRVAEGLLHEAMHLQLTLIEEFVPLVEPTERTYFSPWRNEYRTPLGVLHALYVFHVIDTFFGAILADGPGSESSQYHAFKRRAEIAQQIESIRDFRKYSSLTDAGAAFVSRMLG